MRAQRNNRGVNRAGTLTGQERRQLRLHDARSRRHGFLGFLGCGKAHRFEGNQLNVRQVSDRGVKVTRKRQVEDRVVTARNLLGKQRVGSAGAANNDVGRSHGLFHAVHRHRRNFALCREFGGTTRTGIDPNIGATAFAQRRNGRTRVSARTKNQGAAGRPVLLGNLVRKIEGNRHNGAALGAKRRMLTHLTSRMRRMLKQLNQLTGKGYAVLLCLRLRGGQGAAHLTGDFALADHGRFQAGGDRQQVACSLIIGVHVEAGINQFLVQAGGLRDRISNQLTNHVYMGGYV